MSPPPEELFCPGGFEAFVPSIEQLEDAASGVRREVDHLMRTAREELRLIQDLDAELEDVPLEDALAARTARHVARHRLRAISRQLTMGACILVPVTDRTRFPSAQRVLQWASDAQRADPPYLDASAA